MNLSDTIVQTFDIAAEMPLWVLAIPFGVPHPGKKPVMAPYLGFLPPTWETPVEFWAPGFVLTQA